MQYLCNQASNFINCSKINSENHTEKKDSPILMPKGIGMRVHVAAALIFVGVSALNLRAGVIILGTYIITSCLWKWKNAPSAPTPAPVQAAPALETGAIIQSVKNAQSPVSEQFDEEEVSEALALSLLDNSEVMLGEEDVLEHVLAKSKAEQTRDHVGASQYLIDTTDENEALIRAKFASVLDGIKLKGK